MERVVSIEGVADLRGKQVFKGLFGEDLVIVDDGEKDKPSIAVTTKLTKKENDAVEGWAYKFGISKCKFLRDCITRQLKDLTILTEP